MEPKHFIFPAVALALAGAMVGGQRFRVTEMRSGNEELLVKIASAVATNAPEHIDSFTRLFSKNKEIDWKKVSSLYSEYSDDFTPAMLSFQRRLLDMNPKELLAALDQIDALKVEEDLHDKLVQLILDPLCLKDSQAALERFSGKLGEQAGMHTFYLSKALKDWAKLDLAAATAWLDREIESGTLDPKSLEGGDWSRSRFESPVIFGLLASDTEKAEERLSFMTPKMRAEILGQVDYFKKMGKEDEISFAELVRRQLDGNGRVAAIAERAKKVMMGGEDFAAVDEYLNQVQAAPDEREKSANSAAREYYVTLVSEGKLSSEKIDAMRAWAGRDAPKSVDQLTADALIHAVREGKSMDITKAIELAGRYHESSKNDVLLDRFLSSIDVKGNKEQARDLAGKISDPELRARMMQRFQSAPP